MKKINTLSQITKQNWQKICTSEDWVKAEFQYVLKEIFNNNASYHRKQWEFVTIFICLCQQGKLHKESIGASFGAGKEPLIYHLLPFIKSFHATDLYSWQTGWETAKMGETDTPLDFLHRNAPTGLNVDNLKASEMDMRKLVGIKDNSLDFCYSSCAIEHIGHRKDFIQHLKEVKRVLKSDGVYVVTTEFLFNHDTIANKGNYKFDVDYLKSLFLEVGLDTQEIFDAACEESRLNSPRAFVRPFVGGKNIEKILPVAAILDIEGVAYTSCCFVLSPKKEKQAQTFVINGLEQSSAFFSKRQHNTINKTYTDKRAIDPFYSLNKNSRLYLDDHLKFRVDSEIAPPKFKALKANFCFTDFINFSTNNASFSIEYKLLKHKGRINWFLVSKKPMQVKGRTKHQSKFIVHRNENQYHKVTFNFSALKERAYAVIGQIAPKEFQSEHSELSIESLHISAQILQ